MNKKGILVLMGGLALAACGGPADPHDAHFKGVWKHNVGSDITMQKDDETLDVTADRDSFRIDTKSSGGESIQVFDGHTLYTKTIFTLPMLPANLLPFPVIRPNFRNPRPS